METLKLGNLLVVDDEKELVEALCDTLGALGYVTWGRTSAIEAIEDLKTRQFDLLITDLIMPDMDGITLLIRALEIDPGMVGIIMTGQGTLESAVEAIKAGAFDYILKPFTTKTLLPVVARAMSVSSLKKENIDLKGTLAIYELTKTIHVTMDINTIANRIVQAAMEQCKADEVSIMLPVEDGEELYIAAARGQGSEETIGHHIRMSEGIAGWVAGYKESTALEGKIDDYWPITSCPGPKTGTAVSMPIMAAGRLAGVLNVRSAERRSFTMGQIKGLSIIVGIAAPAVENSRLFEEARAAKEALFTAAEQWQSMFDTISDIIWLADKEGRIVRCNLAATRFFQRPFSDIIGQHCYEIMHSLPEPITDCPWRRMLKTTQKEIAELKVGNRWFRISVDPMFDTAGAIVGTVHSMSDITDLKEAEEKLRAFSH